MKGWWERLVIGTGILAGSQGKRAYHVRHSSTSFWKAIHSAIIKG